MRCPECLEPAVAAQLSASPRGPLRGVDPERLLAAHMVDGDPLCPVCTPNGLQPALPERMGQDQWLELVEAFLRNRRTGAWVDRAVEALRIQLEAREREGGVCGWTAPCPSPPCPCESPPRWQDYPLATSYYKTRMVERRRDPAKYNRELKEE